jgi:hypothetical protein
MIFWANSNGSFVGELKSSMQNMHITRLFATWGYGQLLQIYKRFGLNAPRFKVSKVLIITSDQMHIVLIVEKGNLLCNFMYVLDVIGGGVHTLCMVPPWKILLWWFKRG